MGTSLQRTIYDTAGSYTFTPPDPAIQVVWADIWGAGSGGFGPQSWGANGNSGGGGGAGEFIERKLIPVEGGSLAIVVGAGGTGGSGVSPFVFPGSGEASSVGAVVAGGGYPKYATGYPGCWGGGPLGGQTIGGLPSQSVKGTREAPFETGGNSGGGGGNRTPGSQTNPKDAPGTPSNATSASGGGGAGSSSQWGPGGGGANDGGHPGTAAPSTSNGAGGGGGSSSGGTNTVGGRGADGKVVLYYFVIT